MSVNLNGINFTTWDDVEKEFFTPEEIAESNLRVALIGELIKARKERGISQRELEEMSGVKQPVIARMENGSTCRSGCLCRLSAPGSSRQNIACAGPYGGAAAVHGGPVRADAHQQSGHAGGGF